MRVVDRRGDPPGRSAVNRERFIRRFKDEIKRAVDDEIEKRGIADVGKGSRISIPGRGLREPHFNHDRSTGSRDFVLPGNREYLPGDTIERPAGGEDGGPGNDPAKANRATTSASCCRATNFCDFSSTTSSCRTWSARASAM